MAAKKKTEAKATEAKAVETQVIGFELPQIDVKFLTVKVIGDSPLIVHKWSVKAKREMLQKQMKQATKGKEAKDPEMDYYESMYWLNDMPEEPTKEEYEKALASGEARFGFPAIAFKAAAIDAAFQQGLVSKKTTIRGAFHIIDEYVTIDGTPEMLESMVQIGGMSKVADIRYRGMFPKWSAVLHIRYNAAAITPQQILTFLNFGGFSCGIGEWRPSRDGLYGTFHIETTTEA